MNKITIDEWIFEIIAFMIDSGKFEGKELEDSEQLESFLENN